MSKKLSAEIIISVYSGTSVQYFSVAIQSIQRSVAAASSICTNISISIGVDGPVDSSLECYLNSLSSDRNIRVIYFDQNRGLGPVLADLVYRSNADILIRMDDDDIMCEDRISLCLHEHISGGHDIVCGAIAEFRDDSSNPNRVRLPKSNLSIMKSYFRNPINHVAVSFRRSLALQAGNYRSVMLFEDWDLWLRMRKYHPSYRALNNIFVKVRFDETVVNRRRGLVYTKRELIFLLNIIQNKDLGFILFLTVLPLRLAVRFLPAKLLNKLMGKFLRVRSSIH